MAKHDGFPFIRENPGEDNGPKEAGAYTAATGMKLFAESV
jgi:hypothetical protein